MKNKIIRILQILILIFVICIMPRFLRFMETQKDILKIQNNIEVVNDIKEKNIIENSLPTQPNKEETKKEEITTRSKDTVKKSTPKNKTTSNKNTSTKGYIKFVATAYCPCKQCCGKTNGITASGAKAKAETTVAMSSRYKFGTKIEIKGMGTYIVQDRGGAITENRIDIFFNTHQEALKFGRRTVYLKILE